MTANLTFALGLLLGTPPRRNDTSVVLGIVAALASQLIKARIDRDTRETFVMGEAEDAIDSDPAPEVLR